MTHPGSQSANHSLFSQQNDPQYWAMKDSWLCILKLYFQSNIQVSQPLGKQISAPESHINSNHITHRAQSDLWFYRWIKLQFITVSDLWVRVCVCEYVCVEGETERDLSVDGAASWSSRHPVPESGDDGSSCSAGPVITLKMMMCKLAFWITLFIDLLATFPHQKYPHAPDLWLTSDFSVKLLKSC